MLNYIHQDLHFIWGLAGIRVSAIRSGETQFLGGFQALVE
jgi:hypothetical protein